MTKLTRLWMSLNPLGDVPKGAIPVSVEALGLANCSLKTIPEDIERLDALTELYASLSLSLFVSQSHRHDD